MSGVVQGVGFRPMIHRLATSSGLAGFVRNDCSGAWVEVEGTVESVEAFILGLPGKLPRAGRIDRLDVEPLEPSFDPGFSIAASDAEPAQRHAALPPDLAPCDDCIEELFDPRDRRHRYPFINCTSCGPRFTIVQTLPYDRPNTTMDRFVLCAACRREYEDPSDRRFHAEPIACPACGPTLELTDSGGRTLARDDAALREAAAVVRGGGIVALKGVGGFVLTADATNEEAVARLRRRKRRPDKPLAVMVRDLAHADRIAHLEGRASAELTSAARPIVLLRAREGNPVAPSVAPRLRELGIFLPPTPLQLLLVTDGPPLQVATSGNLSGSPIVAGNSEARALLGDVADVFLTHDRDIHAPADDSVLKLQGAGSTWIRRARGVVPERVILPVEGPPVLGVGGGYKNTVCAAQGGSALLSPHLGDLDHPDALAWFRTTISRFRDALGVDPVVVAHDLHPDYGSTQWARASGIPCAPVQHHHAHAAACLAEHGRRDPVIAVVFDGTGLGDDGTLWGGEFLVADLERYQRLGRLAELPLPGGEAAIREPARLGAVALLEARADTDAPPGVANLLAPMRRLLGVRGMCPRTSSAGRWFDAVASLCAIDRPISYDAQAALELEALAEPGDAQPYALAVDTDETPFVVQMSTVIRAAARDLASGVPARTVSARFHETLAVAIARGCCLVRARSGLETVALSGGCFQNRRLVERTTRLLAAKGFEILTHRRVPPNDGGLSFGQAAVATSRWLSRRRKESPCAWPSPES